MFRRCVSLPVAGEGGESGGGGERRDRTATADGASSSVRSASSSSGDGGRPSSVPAAASPRSSHTIRRSVVTDNGKPSPSPMYDLHRVLKLIEDERHLVAYDLLQNAKRRAKEGRGSKRVDSDCKSARGDGSSKTTPKKMGSTKLRKFGGRGEENPIMDEDGLAEEEQAWDFLQQKKDEFKALENRAAMFINARENLSTDEDWTLAQTMFGITTYYRHEPDGSLSIKIEGELHGTPLFEQIVVLRECDLYHVWAPFMSQSRKLAQLGKLDVVAWYLVGAPFLGLYRDACYRAVGCDCMREDGSVMLVAVGLKDSFEHRAKDGANGTEEEDSSNKSEAKGNQIDSDGGRGVGERVADQKLADYASRSATISPALTASPLHSSLLDTTASTFLCRDAILETIETPPVPQGIGRGRMTIRNFAGSIEILGPSAARTKLVVNVDPNLPLLPQSLIDFSMKKMCGVLLTRLQVAARKVVKNPVENPHARRMREDVGFYRDWLLPKFWSYCEELGWTIPPVGAFNVSEEDLRSEGIFEGWRSGDDNDATSPIPRPASAPAAAATGSGSDDASPDGDEARTASLMSVSTGTGKLRFGKLGHILRDREVRAEEKRLLKIASARKRAAERMKPEPFTKSKAVRLLELKNVKLKAKLRSRSKISAGDDVSACKAADDGGVKWDMLIFVVSLVFNLGLTPFYESVTIDASEEFSFFSISDWIDVAMRHAIVLAMVCLQAVSLWALLNSTLIFAFDSVDFGQKRLVKNLSRGKQLYIALVRKYSLIVSASVLVLSSGIASIEFLFRNAVNLSCTLGSGALWSLLCGWWEYWWDRLLPAPFLAAPQVLSRVPNTALQYNTAFQGTLASATSFVKRATLILPRQVIDVYAAMTVRSLWDVLALILKCMLWIVPRPLASAASKVTTILLAYTWHLAPSVSGICAAEGVDVESWRKKALDTSAFIVTRFGVFALALLAMAYLLMPKPERYSHELNSDTAAKKQQHDQAAHHQGKSDHRKGH